VGMSTSSRLLEPQAPTDSTATAAAASLTAAGLDPQLTGPGRGKHAGSTAAAAGDAGQGRGSTSTAEAAAARVGQLLPDPAEAAAGILQELGECLGCEGEVCPGSCACISGC
jgi:hypothetical protein